MKKLQTKSNLFKDFAIVCLGDSQTDLAGAASFGIASFLNWCSQLCKRLNLRGARTYPRVCGRSGDTTAQMLGRGFKINQYGTPDIAIIYGGVNDPGSGITGTAVSATVSTITLAGTALNALNSYVGNVITITSGTGSGQSKTIIDYTTARVATVNSNWSTTPDATSVYSIAAPTTAQMQANHQAMIKMAKYNVFDDLPIKTSGEANLLIVWNQASLPSNANIGQRMVVMQDNSTTGGLMANDPSMHATIVSDYSASPKQSVWEYRAPMAGEAGWGRVAINTTPTFPEGCSKVISMGSNYLNWTAGTGDNYNVNTSTGTQNAAYIPVRQAAKDAAAAEGTIYCDLYELQSKLIYGGSFLGNTITPETAQNSGTYHYIPTNQHYSAYGHDTVARALVYQIINAGWLPLIS